MTITTTSQSASRIKNAASGRTLEARLVNLFASLTSSLMKHMARPSLKCRGAFRSKAAVETRLATA